MKKRKCLQNFLICLLVSVLVLQPALFSSSMQFTTVAAAAAESEKQDDADQEKVKEEKKEKEEKEEKEEKKEEDKEEKKEEDKEEKEEKKEEEKKEKDKEESSGKKDEDQETDESSSNNETPSDVDEKSDDNKDKDEADKEDSQENQEPSSDEKKSDDEINSGDDKDTDEKESDDADQKEDRQNPEEDEAGKDKTVVSDSPQEGSKDGESVKDPAAAAGESEDDAKNEDPAAADKLQEGLKGILGLPLPGLTGVSPDGAKASKKKKLKIIVTFESVSKEYNGKEQSVSDSDFNVSYEVDGKPDSVSGISVHLTKSPKMGKDAGMYHFSFNKARDYFSVSGVDKDIYNFNDNLPNNFFEVSGCTLKIMQKELTVTTGGGEKTYDGTPLTNPDATINGLVDGETADITATGSQTEVGESENTYKIEWGSTKESNYTIKNNLGILKVTKQELSVSVADATVMYNGSEQTGDTKLTFEGLKEGHKAGIKYTPSKGTNKGTYENGTFEESTLIVLDSDLKDVTDQYTLKSATPGKLEITPCTIHIWTSPGEKVYDGTPLETDDKEDPPAPNAGSGSPVGIGPFLDIIVEGSLVATGSQTDVGTSQNKYTFDLKSGVDESVLDNFEFSDHFGNLQVTPKSLSVSTGSAEKYHDGTPLTNPKASIDGLVGKETATIKATGSQTEIGSSTNTYSITWGTAKESNYKIETEALGTLTVKEPLIELSVSVKDKTMTYDAAELEGNTDCDYTGLKAGHTATIKYTPAKGTNQGTYEGSFDESSLSVKNSAGDDVTELYTLKSAAPGKLTINPLMIKIVTLSDEKVYDGSPLTNDVDVSVLAVGDAPHGSGPFTKAVEVVVTGSQTDVGENDNTYELKVKDGAGKSVLKNFEITDKLGVLKVTPLKIKIVTGSDEKVYDGSPLTNDVDVSVSAVGDAPHGSSPFTKAVEVVVTGSQTEAGESDNTYELKVKDGADESVLKNFEITDQLGILKVTENGTPITLTAASDSKTYDGTALTNSTVTAEGLPDGFTADAETAGSLTDVGSVDNAIADGYTIRNSEGKDVTASFSNITTRKGELTVTPAPLTITTGSDSKVYDGSPLTKTDGITVEGLAENESVTVTATGSQTEVGSSDNTYSIEWDNAKESNYTVTDKLGTLTVTEPGEPVTPAPSYEIRYKLNGGTYDGSTEDIVEEHPEGSVISIHEAPEREGYTFDYWKGSEYQPGDEYTVTGDHVFEAQWKIVSEEKDDEEKVDKEEDNEEKVDKEKDNEEKTQKHSSHDDDDDDDDSHHSHHSSSKSAPTGDSSNAALWIALILLAALGVVGTIIYRRRNRK